MKRMKYIKRRPVNEAANPAFAEIKDTFSAIKLVVRKYAKSDKATMQDMLKSLSDIERDLKTISKPSKKVNEGYTGARFLNESYNNTWGSKKENLNSNIAKIDELMNALGSIAYYGNNADIDEICKWICTELLGMSEDDFFNCKEVYDYDDDDLRYDMETYVESTKNPTVNGFINTLKNTYSEDFVEKLQNTYNVQSWFSNALDSALEKY